MKAYFASSGNLAALSVTTPDGLVMEFDPGQVAQHAAAMASEAASEDRSQSRSRTLGRGKPYTPR